jgi:outer membrane protein assembly factor BamB
MKGPVLLSGLALASLLSQPSLAADAAGWAGRRDGVWSWRLPDTPNGLRPTQSWHAIGSSPAGDIYVSGMDHATNSALYRIDAATGRLRYLGDARAASEAAGNWRPGETAEKFHTRPLWLDGKIYVASLDRSTLGDAYLSRRGFHWYAYDPADGRFRDLSAAEPGGVGAPHLGLVTLAGDAARRLIYGAAVPTGEILRYDLASGRTQNLGRPSSYDRPYVYAGRVMWLGGQGRLYFTAGNPIVGDQPAAIYGHVYFYDPATQRFGVREDWRLAEPRALETGRCLPGGAACVFADDQGHVYRYDEGGPRWSYLGKAATPKAPIWVWMFQPSADGRKAYFATSAWVREANPAWLYEFDLETGRTRRLCALPALDPALGALNLHTGYDSWDRAGRFYLASFTSKTRKRVVVTRIDPVRLKVALGLLPSLVEVGLRRESGRGAPRFEISRSGGLKRPQEVLYRIALRDGEGAGATHYGSARIPAGAASAGFRLDELWPGHGAEAVHGEIAIVANGDDYVAAKAAAARF